MDRSKGCCSAFTLVELLAVIGVILLASAIIFIGGTGGDGTALSSSQRIVSGIAKGARGQAILKNARVRIIIHNDLAADTDKYRRFFGIIYEDTPGSDHWNAGTKGTYLPEGIYFDPVASAAGGLGGGWDPGNTIRLEFPRSIARPPQNTGEEFYYYEFNSNGTMASGFENDWLAIRAGTLRPDSTGALNIVVDEGQQSLISGLIFRPVGTTTPVTDPSAF